MKMKILTLSIFFIANLIGASEKVYAQKETFELVTYAIPKGWKKEVKPKTSTNYIITNQQRKTYCQINIMLSTDSKGGIKEDFESEWEGLIVDAYKVTDTAKMTEPRSDNGWTVKAGMAQFRFNNQNVLAMLTTMSGYGKAVSIVTVTNSQDYLQAIESFMESVEMKVPRVGSKATRETNINGSSKVETPKKAVQPGTSNGFAFTTTNFDDGWVATVEEDWVLVKKGTTRILIHYPNKNADAYNSVLMDGLKNAWNVLVAPRYSSASNMEFKPITSWESIEFAEADLVEKPTGKTVHVVLFKKNSMSGRANYLEFITPDKRSFENEFGAYHQNSIGWEKMANMGGYNKFAVAASDLHGKWTNEFSGNTQYVSAVTGLDAGTTSHASVENFFLGPGNEYKWDLAVASGVVGNLKFQNANSSGKFTVVNNWQVNFSNIEGKPRTFNARFSCIKGLRILWLDDMAFGKVE